MTVTELIEDLQALELGDVEVLLATRRIDGELIQNPKEVHLREIARIEIDANDPEIKLLGKAQAKPDEIEFPKFTISNLVRFLESNSTIADFEVYGIDRRGVMEDGSIVNLNLPLLGVCQGGQSEAWLLLPPQDQWPAAWFPAPA